MGKPGRASGRRRGGCLGLVIGVVLVIVIVSISSSGSSSRSLPKGAWGKTIACLESDPLFLVTDANSSSAGSPNAHTTTVLITSQLHGYTLAEVEDAGSAAAARQVVNTNALLAPTQNYNTDGPIVWAWQEGGNTPHVLASSEDQDDITSCIESPGG